MSHRVKKLKAAILAAGTSFLLSCASSSNEISASYVSPSQYQPLSCEQLAQELSRLNQKKTEMAAGIDKKASSDESVAAVSALLFWPAAFALGGNRALEIEYARLKGEFDAVQQSGVEKNCKLDTARMQVAKRVAPLRTAESALEFYGEAEQEVDSNDYDRNLWARALVESEGDETRRKARYIELRARQLYLENVGRVSNPGGNENASLEGQAVSGYFVTGTYTSVATGPSHFLTKKPNPMVWLVQGGNKITGSYGELNKARNGTIFGEIDGDTISIEWNNSQASYGKGKWKLLPDSNEIVGKWYSTASQGGDGNWNLTKIE